MIKYIENTQLGDFFFRLATSLFNTLLSRCKIWITYKSS